MYLALDVGGTSINMGLYKNLDPESLVETTLLKVKNDFEADMSQISETVKNWTTSDLKGIALGVPGIINEDETKILHTANLGGWLDKDIVGHLSRVLNCPNVYLCHDVKAAALSEVEFNHANEDFALIIWGTGIGCTYVRFCNNVPDFQQVELGYQTINNTIVINGEEHPGYLQYYCGGKDLERKYGKSASELNEKEWEIVLNDMSYGITNLLTLNYTDKLIFSGGVSNKQAHRLSRLSELVREKNHLYPQPSFSIAKYGENTGLVGALGLLKLKLSSKK